MQSRRRPFAAVLCAVLGVVLLGAAPVTAAGLMTNGSFESTGTGWLSPWYFTVRSGAAATLAQSSASRTDGAYSAHVSVTTSSTTSPWLVQLSQSGVALTAGRTYTLTFSARADRSRPVDAVVQQTASPYVTYATTTSSLTSSWASYSLAVTPSASVSDATIRFNLAAAVGSVWIDDVRFSDATASTTSTVTMTPSADTYVRSDIPSANYGSVSTLSSDGTPIMVAYLKFDLGAVAGKTISSAKLRMKVTNPSGATHNVRSVADTAWSETAVTYNSRPAVGSTARTLTGPSVGSWVETDVTPAVTGKAGSLAALAVDTTGSDGLAFSSRETSTDKPALVVTYASTTTPTPAAGKGASLRPFPEYWGSNRAGMDSDMNDLRAAGVTWARFDLQYTDPPNPNFDAAVESAKAAGVSLLITVRKPWPTHDLGTQADRDFYKAWLANMVQRYGHHVKHWEIQNEPNLHYEWNIDESTTSDQTQYEASVKRYLTVLQDAYGVIKANDPTATVLFGGLSEWRVERYMDVVLTTDAYRYFDVMSFHPYGSTPDRVLARYTAFTSKMSAKPEYAAKPIWVTETGFNTSWDNKAGFVTSETTKADYLRQTLPRLHSAGAKLPIFWYTLHENDSSPGYGLTVKDRSTLRTTYLPAYTAYRDLVP